MNKMSTLSRAFRYGVLAGLAALVSVYQPVIAGPAAVVPVTLLASQADTVIIATVSQGTVVGGVTSATLLVERPLKGDLLPGATVLVMWTGPPAIQSRVYSVAPDRGLFFLRRDVTGRWVIVPGWSGEVSFQMSYFVLPGGPEPAQFTPAPTASVLDKVLLELAWVREVGVPRPGGAAADLVSEYRRSRSEVLRGVFKRWGQSTSPRLRPMALQALVGDGDLNALAAVEAEQSTLTGSPVGREVMTEIKIYFRNSDPAAVRTLGRLATSPSSSPDLKDASAAALARLHTREALPYLAELLDSPVLWLRTYAVGGLAMFANNVPVGSHHPAPGEWAYRTEETMAHSAMSPDLISSKESYYIGFWKDWWASHRVKLTGR
jgi:hypothetical protein